MPIAQDNLIWQFGIYDGAKEVFIETGAQPLLAETFSIFS